MCRSRGCSPEEILRPLGLTLADLFPSENGHRPKGAAPTRVAAAPTAEELAEVGRYCEEANRRLAGDSDVARKALAYVERRFGLDPFQAVGLGLGVDSGSTVVDRPAALASFQGPPRLVVPFKNAAGEIRGLQGRALGPARAKWTSPKGSGWARWGAFNLEAHDPVFLCEGPGDALATAGAGFAAVAIRGAALGADPELVTTLAKRIVFVVGDADQAGTKFRTKVVNTLRAAGGRVGWLDVPEPYDDLAAWCEAIGGSRFAEELLEAQPVPPADEPGVADRGDVAEVEVRHHPPQVSVPRGVDRGVHPTGGVRAHRDPDHRLVDAPVEEGGPTGAMGRGCRTSPRRDGRRST